MPYFIILPIYALLLAFLVIAAIFARYVESWRPASGYLVGGTVGSFLGFIVANLIVTLAGVLPVLVARHLTPPQWLQQAGAVVVAAILLVGPFVASAMGVILGFAAGVFFVFRRRRRRAANLQIEPRAAGDRLKS